MENNEPKYGEEMLTVAPEKLPFWGTDLLQRLPTLSFLYLIRKELRNSNVCEDDKYLIMINKAIKIEEAAKAKRKRIKERIVLSVVLFIVFVVIPSLNYWVF
jgi:hypothetical protein